MPIKNIDFTDHQASFIQESIDDGRYHDANEVVGAGLRLLEQQEAENRIKLDMLRRVMDESIKAFERGEYTSHTVDTLDGLFSELDSEIRAERSNT